MKDSKKSQTHPSHNMVFTVTTPTQELKSGQYVEQLVQAYTSYQLIPAPLALNYDAEHVLLSVLPYTKNKLLDLTLPFVVTDETANQTCYLGRYLLLNQRLVGVRLSSGKKEENYPNSEFKKWKSGRITKYKVPKSLLDYYKNSRFPEGTFALEVTIGDFLLSINDMKICMLFESEVEDSEQTLFECKRQGCEIFSIVCDLPREPAFESTLTVSSGKQATRNQNLFKRFMRQHNKLIMYAGARIATSKALFLSNSFILHPELPEKTIEPFYFNDGVSLSLLCNTELMKKAEISQSKREKVVESKAKPELYLDFNLAHVRSAVAGKSIKLYAGSFSEGNLTKEQGDLLKKMKIWHIFCHDNQKRPFITAIPLSEKMADIAKELIKLSQIISCPMSSLLVLYKKRREQMTSEAEEQLGADIYEDLADLVARNHEQKLNIYTDDHEQYRLLASVAQKNDRMILYFDHFNSAQENRAKVERANKLTDFANFIIRNRIVGYQKILREARSEGWRLSKEDQVEAVAVHLRNKLRTEISHEPFYKSILEKRPKDIKLAMIDAEACLLQTPSLMVAEPSASQQEEEEVAEGEDKDFWARIKEVKKMQNRQMKKSYSKCHRCSFYHEKQWFYRCPSCRIDTCYICQSECQSLANEPAPRSRKEFLDTLKCYPCRKLCDCANCQTKEKPEESTINLTPAAVVEVSVSSLAQAQAQEEKASNDYRDWCTVCLINGRNGSRIKVGCSSCDREECLLCIRSENRKTTTISSSWQCSFCKPEEKPAIVQPMIDEQGESNADKAVESERRPRPRDASASKSNDGAQPRKVWNHNNNQKSNSHGQSNSNSRPFSQRQQDSSFNRNQMDQRDEKRSVSASRSHSPPPPQRPPPHQNNARNQNPPNRSRSASCSVSPPRNAAKNSEKKRSPSHSVSNSPPKGGRPAMKRRSPSCSNSPPRAKNTSQNQSYNRNNNYNQNNSQSNNQKAYPIRNQNQRNSSASRSGSPVRAKANNNNNNTQNESSSPQTPRKPPPKPEERKRSVSNSQTPPKQKKKASVSRSRSGSNSRSRSRERNAQKKQPEKLWEEKPKNDEGNSYHRDGNSYNRENNRDGGYNSRDSGYNNRDGGYNNRGGFNNRGGGYNRSQGEGGNYDRSQGGDRGNFRGGRGNFRGRGGGYNNNYNRDRDGNNNSYSGGNNYSNSNSYSRNSNNNGGNNNYGKNSSEGADSSNLINLPQVYESNMDMDY